MKSLLETARGQTHIGNVIQQQHGNLLKGVKIYWKIKRLPRPVAMSWSVCREEVAVSDYA